MTCETLSTWVDDYVDGTLEASDRDLLGEHVATCVSCAALVEDVRRIQRATRLLRAEGSLNPPDEVWKRIEAAVPQAPRRHQAPVTTATWRDWLAAAAGLVLVVGSLTWTSTRLPRPVPSVEVAESEAWPQFQMAQAAYEEAIDDLQRIADDTASPTVAEPALAELRAGLSDLDTAILEAESTLAEAPDDPFSQEQLLAALGDKVAVLQDTVLQDTLARLDDAALGGANGPEGTNP